MSKSIVESGARRVVIGWLEPGSTRRDAMDFAKAYAQRHFDAPDVSWFAIMPFMQGWLYEIQEGGNGRSYLNGVVRALASGAENQWIRVGSRVMTVGLRDGKPFCVLLSQNDSALLMEAEGQISTAGKMQRVIRRGTGVLVSGLAVASMGFLFLASAAGFHVFNQQYTPPERNINVDLLPHAQWDRVGSVPPNLYVERLELLPGSDRWETTVKPIIRSAETAPPESPIDDDEPVSSPAVPEPETVVQQIVESATAGIEAEDEPAEALPSVEPLPAPVPLPQP